MDEDLEKEINYLMGFDKAYKALNDLLDWPTHSLELFIRIVEQNNGSLSKTKRDSHFDWMKEEEIETAEQLVVDSFKLQ